MRSEPIARQQGRSQLALSWLLATAALVCGGDSEDAPEPPLNPGVRRRVDDLLAAYDPKGQERFQWLLAEWIVAEGKDAVPYLAWRLAHEQWAEVKNPTSGISTPVFLLIDVLGRHADPRGLTALRAVLEHGDVVRREAAVRSIARIPGVESYRVLLNALADECGEVAARAQEELAAIAGSEPGFDPGREALDAARRTSALRPGVAQLLVRIGNDGASDLVHELLDEQEPSLRILAVQLLPRVDGDAATEVLLERLTSDESTGVRKEACISLGGLGSTDAIEPLITLLEEADDAGLRANVLWALQQITGQRLSGDVERWRLWWDMHRPR